MSELIEMTISKHRKVIISIFVAILIVGGTFFLLFRNTSPELETISIKNVLGLTSRRRATEEVIIISDENPFHSIISSPAACWYDITPGSTEPYGLRPLLIGVDSKIDNSQERFLSYYGSDSLLLLGDVDEEGTKFTGSASKISLEILKHEYESTAGVLIVPETEIGYELGIAAAPLASYLNIPIIVVDDSTKYDSLNKELEKVDVEYCITVGPNAKSIAEKTGFKAILLEDSYAIAENVLTVIKDRFGKIDYITMTNPSDVIPPYVVDSNTETFEADVENVKITTGRTETDIIGESTETYDIEVPSGINLIRIYVNFTSVSSTILDPLKEEIDIEPLIFASLYDDSGKIAAYGPSFSLDVGKTYLETLTVEAPGTYQLKVSVYYGTAGFDTYAGTQVGLSKIEGKYQVTVETNTLSKPHNPIFEKTSMITPYLTAAHGGILLADSEFELTDETYADKAQGHSTGPWYDVELNEVANEKVDKNVRKLNNLMELLQSFDLYEGYMNGSSWLAIVGGANMIPMYYEPKEAAWVEDPVYGVGWATDVKYSLNVTLSTARPLGRNIGDISTLIGRTLFYEEYAKGHSKKIQAEYGNSETWLDHFHFLAGEGGGRTGWFFWQRTFAPEVEQHGFRSEVYVQNYENDRQTMEMGGAYERANYFDLMLHGNWYWYVPELNGFDRYSTGVKVSDLMTNDEEWELGPSVLNSGVCIMGRIDGVAPTQSITTVFIHSGINAFYSSTRSTGSEAKAGTIETSLLYDDISVGEALRLDKNTNVEPAAFFVRNLYADPAFNPYEPENGFSDQGRPILQTNGD